MKTHNSERLRRHLALVVPALRAAGARFAEGERLRAAYPIYLCSLHGLVRSAVPLLEAALEQAKLLVERSDPLAPALVEYYFRHSKEERGHDSWVVQDIEALGLDSQAHVARVSSTIGSDTTIPFACSGTSQ